MSAPTVAVVILNWNLPDDTNTCVDSVLRSDYPHVLTVVVDNGSTPENIARLRTSEQGAELVRNEQNLGFAEGCNVGVRYALEHGADYVLLINNDTTIAEDMISRLMAVAQANPQLGVIGPLIFYASAPEQVWFGGQRFWRQLYMVRRDFDPRKERQPVVDVDFISGCGLLAPRAVWEQVGLLSRDYFMYYEDLDFCVRVKRHGYRLACVPAAKMWHAVSASSGGSESPAKQRMQIKSSLIFYNRHTRGLWWLVNIALRFGYAGFNLLKYVWKRRLSWAVVRAFVAGLWDWRKERA